ncbi:hypothetical protein [Methylobacter sp. YRD-M1]|uniref:hypothetical protein n=1 Tax=Methylobacter sp. YRD-M1 TaxID=2911520 RepID=UPI00227B42C4|nr:hypothetical protein [Methylobacter sp. YRD-M1]WAK01883.1 hemolysin XhlA family protein [Methylobacter sp. YRD-M1]
MDAQRCYDFESRLARLERDVENMDTVIDDLKTQIRDDQTELKNAMRDLATSQANQAISMAKIESSISTLSKGVGIGLPLLVSIVGGLWSYNDYINSKIEHNPTKIAVSK